MDMPTSAPHGDSRSSADPARELERQTREFARLLGSSDPVPVEALEAAVRDEAYARLLLSSRRSPAALRLLLARPPKPRAEVEPAAVEPVAEHTNAELVKRAAGALLRWGATGFSVVDAETLRRRREACGSCPHWVDPPERLLYKALAAGERRAEEAPRGADRKICALCGCGAFKKTRLPTEVCPDPHPDRQGLSRWGEPFKG